MRLKTRPDLHHAPLDNGVYVSCATGEFALSGWSGFADLMARCLPLLGQGSDEDHLVAEIGNEKARPAIRHLLTQLEAHDMILRLDSLDPAEPNTDVRAEHAELLAYLECRSHQPYAAFDQVLSSRILLDGPEGGVAAASSALKELGITKIAHDERLAHDVAVVLMTRDQVLQASPRAARFLPVVLDQHAALVGPVVQDLKGWVQWRTLLDRTLNREGNAVDQDGATVVAASSAIHLLLQNLASIAGPDAYLITGETLDIHALDLPPDTAIGHDEVSLSTATDEGHDADLSEWITHLTHPWLGPAWGVEEEKLPQMPIALRRFATQDQQIVVAEGTDQHQAASSAVLALTRATNQTPAAGSSALRWLLDGGLAHFARHLNPGTVFSVDEPRGLRLFQTLLTETSAPELTLHTAPGISWVLIKCVHGPHTTSAWGPTGPDAAQEALSRAVAIDHLPTQAPASFSEPGTAALRSVTSKAAHELAFEMQQWMSTRALRLIGSPHPVDPHLGQGPVHTGEVRVLPTAPKKALPTSAQFHIQTVETLLQRPDTDVLTTLGWDPGTIGKAVETATSTHRALIQLQLATDTITVGPVWSSTSQTGCPACAETRRRTVLDHTLGVNVTATATPTSAPPASLIELTATVLRSTRALKEGEVIVVSTDGARRHKVLRHPTCPWCRPTPGSTAPTHLNLIAAQVAANDPTRVAQGTPLLDPAHLEASIDERYGPLRGIVREKDIPYAMSMAVLSREPFLGHGRAISFDQTRSVAVLEAYERFAGFPYEAPLVMDRAYTEVADHAIDPNDLGQYSAEQLAHPSSKALPYHPDLPIDWAWGIDLATQQPRLIPAEVGFYQYDHAFKRDLRSARAATSLERRRIFIESSSGCALGSSLAEAAIHALFEVAERDAFLLAWYRSVPLPTIPINEFADPVINELVALIQSRGFEVHFLKATSDIDIPVIWVLAIAADGSFPASFSSAGSGADPTSAARAGLREVAQLATMHLDWTEEEATQIFNDSWKVRELEDHVKWSSAPQALPRIRTVLGGPITTLNEAFPRWPEQLQPHDGNILTTLQLVADRFTAAGLDEIIVVDQSTCEHADQGIYVVKTVVPGTVPMVFGQAHQRLLGIPRLQRALGDQPDQNHPYDPHPFP